MGSVRRDSTIRELTFQSNDESPFWLDATFRSRLRRRHELSPAEARGARELDRRALAALDGDVDCYDRERDPFVLVERRHPTG